MTWIASERKSESSKYIIFGENEYENGSLGLSILKHSEVTKEGQKAWGRNSKVGLNLKLIGYLLLNRSCKFIYHPLWKTSYYALNSKISIDRCFNVRD